MIPESASSDVLYPSLSRVVKPPASLPFEFIPPIPLDRLKLKHCQLHVGSVVFQPALYFIPWLHRPHTGRGAGQDHVARLERLTMWVKVSAWISPRGS